MALCCVDYIEQSGYIAHSSAAERNALIKDAEINKVINLSADDNRVQGPNGCNN
jgi:hypothetical protein